MKDNKTDVIVVGAGPAGIACAITIAKAGKQVVLIERGKFAGSKNVFGGAIYAQPTREIFPEFEQSAPIERKTVEHKFALLGENDGTVISYKNSPLPALRATFPEGEGRIAENVSYSVIRGKFDRWMAEEARKKGVILVEETVVRDLLLDKGYVVGVRTELEEYYADIVVLADGVNSLLAKQIGLRNDIKPEDVALSVKEVYKLPENIINERFHVSSDEGCIYEIFGGPMLGMLGLGFLYTNKDSVSIGLGVTLSELIKKGLRPYELLDKLKAHPEIAPLLKDGELLEYSAHLIPEGGYKKIPKVVGNGVMVCGDAAMLVNNMHWEGTNLAMISGKLAGETAVIALGKNDFSEHSLSRYADELEESFIIKDLRTYKDLMSGIESRVNHFLGYYPEKINSFFKMFTTTDSVPKRESYRKFIKSIFTDRKFTDLFKDAWCAIKLLWSILVK